MDFYTIFLLMVTLCSVQTHAIEQVRGRRRSDREGDMPMTLDELRILCTDHRWERCREAIDFLRDNNSTFNQDYQKCISDSKISISIQDTLLDSSNNQSSGCPHRAESRNLYCEYAKTITEESQTAVAGELSLDSFKNCPAMNPTAEHGMLNKKIISMFNVWIDHITAPRKFAKNCAPCGEKLKDLPQKDLLTSDSASSLSAHFCENLKDDKIQDNWETNLIKLAKLMRVNDLLDSLGRKRKGCLRGCVKASEVACIHHALIYDPLTLKYSQSNQSSNKA